MYFGPTCFVYLGIVFVCSSTTPFYLSKQNSLRRTQYYIIFVDLSDFRLIHFNKHYYFFFSSSSFLKQPFLCLCVCFCVFAQRLSWVSWTFPQSGNYVLGENVQRQRNEKWKMNFINRWWWWWRKRNEYACKQVFSQNSTIMHFPNIALSFRDSLVCCLISINGIQMNFHSWSNKTKCK